MPRSPSLERLVLDEADFDRYEVQCPAGVGVKLPQGCHCRANNTFVTAARDPSTLGKFCMGAYWACPVWRADNVREGE